MPSRRLALWTLLAFAVLAALAAVRVADWSYGADSGTFVQLILDAGGGMRDGVEHGTHYRFHWSPALAILWPLLAADRPAALWILQAVLAAATVACAPLVALFAAERLPPRLAQRCGYVALLYPPLVAVGFGEFRDLGVLPVLALGWWVALCRRAWGWAAAAAVLLVTLREDVCLELIVIGGAVAVLAARRGERERALAAALSALAGALSLAVYAALVLPRVGPWPPAHFYDYPFAEGPAELLAAPFVHPLAFIAAIATLGRLTYLLEALVPLAFVPLRTPRVWLAVPGFAIVLLANSGLVWRMGMHYAALWIPWLLVAFAAGIAALRRPGRWCAAALALSAIVLVAFSPLHPAHYLRPSYRDLADARAALALVPASASVATHDEWYTAIAATHPRATILGDAPPPADYVVYAADYPNAAFAQRVLPRVQRLVDGGDYRLVFHHGDVYAYRRLTPSQGAPFP